MPESKAFGNETCLRYFEASVDGTTDSGRCSRVLFQALPLDTSSGFDICDFNDGRCLPTVSFGVPEEPAMDRYVLLASSSSPITTIWDRDRMRLTILPRTLGVKLYRRFSGMGGSGGTGGTSSLPLRRSLFLLGLLDRPLDLFSSSSSSSLSRVY